MSKPWSAVLALVLFLISVGPSAADGGGFTASPGVCTPIKLEHYETAEGWHKITIRGGWFLYTRYTPRYDEIESDPATKVVNLLFKGPVGKVSLYADPQYTTVCDTISFGPVQEPPLIYSVENRPNQIILVGKNLRGYVQDDRTISATLYRRDGTIFKRYDSQAFSGGSPEAMQFRVGVVPPDFVGTLVYDNGWGKSPPTPIFTGPYVCPKTAEAVARLTQTQEGDWRPVDVVNWLFYPPNLNLPPAEVFVPYFGRMIPLDSGVKPVMGETVRARSVRFECP